MVQNVAYHSSLFEFLSQVEGHHFWYSARRKIVITVLKRFTKFDAQKHRLLDVGTGSGYTLKWLKNKGIKCYGIDVFYEALKLA